MSTQSDGVRRGGPARRLVPARWVAATGVCLLIVAAVWTVSEVRDAHRRSRFADQRRPFVPSEVMELGRMPTEIAESSGLGLSRVYPGVVWTHNDSGDGPRFYAIDQSATLLATVELEGVTARDWEAMALGRCPHRTTRSCLYAADIGDNRSRRDSVVVHVVEEPDPFAGDTTVGPVGSVPFVYPDGPHDAEGLAITSAGDLVIVTKEREQLPLVFRIPAATVGTALHRDAPVTLEAGARLPIRPDRTARRYTTGAALSPRDDLLAVRTYSEIFFFRWPLPPDPRPVGEACFLGETEPQGEAISFRDEGWLVLTSETTVTRPGWLLAARCY